MADDLILVVACATTLGVYGTLRGALAVFTDRWLTKRYDRVIGLLPNCSDLEFHTIQNQPKPWYVKVNQWMEVHHV